MIEPHGSNVVRPVKDFLAQPALGLQEKILGEPLAPSRRGRRFGAGQADDLAAVGQLPDLTGDADVWLSHESSTPSQYANSGDYSSIRVL
jgi:hypothetical protein